VRNLIIYLSPFNNLYLLWIYSYSKGGILMDNRKKKEEVTLLNKHWDSDPSASDDESFENELERADASNLIPDNRK
jgi:hypothetical protein